MPPTERMALLQDYLSGLVASICRIDAEKVAADVPLLALGVDSYAAISIQHTIRADLGTHLTASDLAYTASIAELAARLDSQLVPEPPARAGDAPPASPPRPADGDFVRLYRWVSGSRVPVHVPSESTGHRGSHPRSR